MFIKFISVVTGKNFVVDPAVQGKVKIISQGTVDAEQAYATFESVLEMHGYSAVEEGTVVKIVPWEKAITKSDVHLYEVKHYMADDVAKIIEELPRHNGSGKSGQSVSSEKINVSIDNATNSLIVSAKRHEYSAIQGSWIQAGCLPLTLGLSILPAARIHEPILIAPAALLIVFFMLLPICSYPWVININRH